MIFKQLQQYEFVSCKTNLYTSMKKIPKKVRNNVRFRIVLQTNNNFSPNKKKGKKTQLLVLLLTQM